MGLKTKRALSEVLIRSKFGGLRLKLVLLWIHIKYEVYDRFLQLTAKWRLKCTKKLVFSSMAYCTDQMTWDDVDVSDQWGQRLPIGFGICSKKSWEFDNMINCDIGEPEDPWRDVVKSSCEKHMKKSEDCPVSCGWVTYYFKEDFLDSRHYFLAARKHLMAVLGDKAYEKDLLLELTAPSQKMLDDEMKKQIDWIAKGSPKMKITFSDQAKEDLKRILGEEEANKLIKDIDNQEDAKDS